MRIVALLAARNEGLYMERCLEHLYSQGIEICLIDNGSSDNTLEIAEGFTGRGLFRIEHLPFTGKFDLEKILRLKEALAAEIKADWFIHHDADEIREAPKPYRTLKEGIEDADKQGYNAINFDEFVFLPTSDAQSFEGRDYVSQMKHYYFFEPRPQNRINAWKNTRKPADLRERGGHRVSFEGRKIFPVNFVLRHYIFLSRAHAMAKYGGRSYPEDGVKRGLRKRRMVFFPEKLIPADSFTLKTASTDAALDRSAPKKQHEFFGGAQV